MRTLAVVICVVCSGFVAGPVAAASSYLYEWGARGSAPGELTMPNGLDVTPDGTVWVADAGNGRAESFAPDGALRNVVGHPVGDQGSADRDGLFVPRDVAVAPDGTVLVADTPFARLQRYRADGELLAVWGLSPGPSHEAEPWSLAIGRSGTVFVADRQNDLVRALDLDGHELGSIGSGVLNEPVGVAVADDGRVFVVDRQQVGIHVFGSSGSYLYSFETRMAEPWDAAAGLDGSLWVAGGGTVGASHYTADGELVEQLIRPFGAGPGEFQRPFGIGVSCGNRVYLDDAWRHRVLVFGDEASAPGPCQPRSLPPAYEGEPAPPRPPPAPQETAADHRAPRLVLRLARRQRLGRHPRLRLRTGCDETCALSVQLLQRKRGHPARFAATFSDFSASERRVDVALAGTVGRRVRTQLRRGNRRFLVRVRAVDHAGNSVTATRQVVLRSGP